MTERLNWTELNWGSVLTRMNKKENSGNVVKCSISRCDWWSHTHTHTHTHTRICVRVCVSITLHLWNLCATIVLNVRNCCIFVLYFLWLCVPSISSCREPGPNACLQRERAVWIDLLDTEKHTCARLRLEPNSCADCYLHCFLCLECAFFSLDLVIHSLGVLACYGKPFQPPGLSSEALLCAPRLTYYKCWPLHNALAFFLVCSPGRL